MRIVPAETEITRQLIQEARQISVAYPVIEPLLQKRKDQALKRLLSHYRDSKHLDQQNVIAELFVIEGIMVELKSKLDNVHLGGKDGSGSR